MAQSAANWHNKHTNVDCMHSRHTYSYINTVTTTLCEVPLSYYIIFGIKFIISRYLREGEQTGVPGEKPQQLARKSVSHYY